MSEWQTRTAKGAAGELVACAHLIRTGWHVYRSETPNAPFDLVAYRDGQMLRVEVKTVCPMSGAASFIPTFCWPANTELFDLLVVVDLELHLCVEIATKDRQMAKTQLRAAYGLTVAEPSGDRERTQRVKRVLASEPGREWRAAEVYAVLLATDDPAAQGDKDLAMNRVRSSLYELFQSGHIERPRWGTYSVRLTVVA